MIQRNISFLLLLLGTAFATGSFAQVQTPPMNFENQNFSFTGLIADEAFVDKGLRERPHIRSYFFVEGDAETFIKLCAGKVTAAEVVMSLGCQVTLTAFRREGLWDDGCIKHEYEPQSRVGKYLAVIKMERNETPSYAYADGSWNKYVITSDSIEYIPVKPHESSSGTYDGGEPVRVALSPEDFAWIEQQWVDLRMNRALHTGSREMGTGIFTRKTAAGDFEFILKNTETKQELETKLRALIGR